jgi:CheY-like chemotaxis protein
VNIISEDVCYNVQAVGEQSLDVAMDSSKCTTTTSRSFGRFHAVIIDYEMSSMDGATATSLMRQAGYEGLIVGISSRSSSTNADNMCRFMSAGADLIMEKPLDCDRLVHTLRECLSGPPRPYVSYPCSRRPFDRNGLNSSMQSLRSLRSRNGSHNKVHPAGGDSSRGDVSMRILEEASLPSPTRDVVLGDVQQSPNQQTQYNTNNMMIKTLLDDANRSTNIGPDYCSTQMSTRRPSNCHIDLAASVVINDPNSTAASAGVSAAELLHDAKNDCGSCSCSGSLCLRILSVMFHPLNRLITKKDTRVVDAQAAPVSFYPDGCNSPSVVCAKQRNTITTTLQRRSYQTTKHTALTLSPEREDFAAALRHQVHPRNFLKDGINPEAFSKPRSGDWLKDILASSGHLVVDKNAAAGFNMHVMNAKDFNSWFLIRRKIASSSSPPLLLSPGR